MRYNEEREERSRVSFRNFMCIRRRRCAGKLYCGVTLLLDGPCHCGGVEITLAKGHHDCRKVAGSIPDGVIGIFN